MYMLTMTKETYTRTDSGKGWRSKPYLTETDTRPWRDTERGARSGQEIHNNITNADTLRFFRRLGGTEYAERGYTPVGYIVTRLVSTSPDGETRIVRTFKITEPEN